MYYQYNGFYFKLKNLRDYQYLSTEDFNTFKWRLVVELYTHLHKQGKLELYNDLTGLSIKQQNDLIMKSMHIPKPYLSIYKEK